MELRIDRRGADPKNNQVTATGELFVSIRNPIVCRLHEDNTPGGAS